TKAATDAAKITRKRVSSLKPSPENQKLYKAIDANSPEIVELAESIRRNGLQQPLVVTRDGWIVSGHQRYAALKRIDQKIAPCIVLPVRRSDLNDDEFIALLREHNRQRHKSVAEQARETMVDIDPARAHEQLRRLRDNSVYAAEKNGVYKLRIEGTKHRHNISEQKADHVSYTQQVVFEDRSEYWPLSVRAVHYALLNYEFYRNIPRKIRYRNDAESYAATSDLITRLRLLEELPWEAFTDGTRPIATFSAFEDVRQFLRHETENLFDGYWRDLLQTQPNHVEVLCEKNTVYHMVLSVTRRYQIPTASGRGFNSIDPWHELCERYHDSGKERLIVIVLSDYDPEGEMIPQVGGRTLRDDFGIEDFAILKAGVTPKQIKEHSLPSMNFAKESSSNYEWFVKRSGGTEVYELEALEPQAMLDDLERVIQNTLDIDLFNAEASREQDEAVYLAAAREKATEALRGLAE
ncbi:MAG: ParB N-terminal domain-containing protein, partial [Pirellulales bacterium]